MDDTTAKRLLELNRQFYQTFALQFSQTRQRIQPGVRKILGQIPPDSVILDMGCGNGELLNALIQEGHTGWYVGLDSSPGLLQIARQRVPTGCQSPFVFLQADLASPDWDVELIEKLSQYLPNFRFSGFDAILAFAVLHHLPGHALQRQTLEKAYNLASTAGLFIHSEWQFLNSAKLRSRLQPWSQVDLDENLVDAGDYLLDWKHGGNGLRYVHQYNETELAALAKESQFTIRESFASDGEDGNLSLYQIWTAVK